VNSLIPLVKLFAWFVAACICFTRFANCGASPCRGLILTPRCFADSFTHFFFSSFSSRRVVISLLEMWPLLSNVRTVMLKTSWVAAMR